MNKNLIVVSHRRSGTHLTLDSIINNFSVFNKNNMVVLGENIEKSLKEIDRFNNKKKLPVLIKTHFLPDFKIYTSNIELQRKLNELFEESNIIYVYRNGLDVMVSLYEYMKRYDDEVKKMKFKEFLFSLNNFDKTAEKYNRIQFWNKHIELWKQIKFSKNIFYVKYEDLNSNYENTIVNISEKFEISTNKKIIDIRLKNYKVKNRKIRKIINFFKGKKTTSVSARKGTTGDYKNYFDKESLDAFYSENLQMLKSLNYE